MTKTARKLRLKCFSSPPLQVKDFKLQGSNNDADWDDILSTTAADSDAWQAWAFSNSNAYRYYRILITSSYTVGNTGSIREIELMEELAPGWLSGWGHRKVNPVKGTAAGAQTNYQMRMTVHKGAGTDTVTDVYCGGNCRDDFGDIRWTKDDGVTPMDYWIEELVSGDYAVFWIEIPSVLASPSTVDIYMYYDKSDETSLSDGDATFLLFDHFLGASLDLTKWTKTGTVTVSNSEASVINIRAWTNYFRSNSTFSRSNTAYRARAKGTGTNATGYWQIFFGYTDSIGYAHPIAGAVFLSRFRWAYDQNGTPILVDEGISYATNVYYTFEWKMAYPHLYYDRNDVNKFSKTDWSTTHDNRNIFCGGSDGTTTFDWVLVRKYASPEPAWGAWGAQEILALFTTSAKTTDLISLGWGVDERAEAKATDLLASKAEIYQSHIAEARATDLITLAQILHIYQIAEVRATELVTLTQLLHIYKTAETKATDVFSSSQTLQISKTAEAKVTDLITLRQVLHLYQTAEARATVPISPKQILHVQKAAESMASATFVAPWVLFLTAEARASEAIALRQILHVPAIAEARATDLVSPSQLLYLCLSAEARATDLVTLRQLLYIYKTAGAKATDLFSLAQLLYLYPVAEAKAKDVLEPLGWVVPLLAEARATDIALPLQALLLYPTAEARAEAPPAYGWGFEQLARARATELIALRQVLHIPIAAEAKVADLVSPAQLLHLYLPAVAKAADLVSPSQLLRIYKTADTRASDLFATRQVFRISELADVRATDLFEVKKGITALFTAAVKANAPVTLRQLIRAYLIASARVVATKTGKRKHPDRYMPTICLWYFDIDTGEVLPETFE